MTATSFLDSEEIALPKEWRMELIADAYRFTRKPKEIRYSDFATIQFLPMSLIPDGGAMTPSFKQKPPNEISSGTYFEKGDLLLSKITPSFENGKQAIASNLPTAFGIATTEVIPIQAIHGTSDIHFLFYYLLKNDVRKAIAAKMEGSTGRQRVPEHVVREWLTPLPPIDEQEKIAAVLWKIQEAVETEEAIVRNAGDLKKSLLRRLFTNGLRGEPLKETEIGAVPQSWEIVELQSVAKFASGGTPSKQEPSFWSGDIPWVSPKDMKTARLHDTEDHISAAGLATGSNRVKAGALFVVIRGMILNRDLPIAIAMTPMAFNQDMKAILPNETIDTEFLLYTFQSQKRRLVNQIGTSAHGTRTLMSDYVAKFQLALPEKEEQREIAATLQTVDRKIDIHESKKRSLQDLFKTMLHKLMTAQIRVNDLEINTRELD